MRQPFLWAHSPTQTRALLSEPVKPPPSCTAFPGIPQGDLFTVLEASTPEHIQHAMNVILEIEAEAAQRVSLKPGLLPLLQLLRERKVGSSGRCLGSPVAPPQGRGGPGGFFPAGAAAAAAAAAGGLQGGRRRG